MSSSPSSRDAAHFERLYDANPDPWRLRTSAYEKAKYRKTLASLGRRQFDSAVEVGCSIGVLTHLLAPRCRALLAIDIIEQPLRAARAACADQHWVRFERMRVPSEWPEGTFDLIVLSEFLYFLAPPEIRALAARVVACLRPSGLVLLVNWLGRSDDPCTGDQAADFFIQRTQAQLAVKFCYREAAYRLDVLTSPAATTDHSTSGQ